MALIGNILWHFPFLGFITAAFFFLIGYLLTLTVVLAPVGLGLIEYSKFLLWPFGNKMIRDPKSEELRNELWENYSTIIMILYIPFGIILSIITALQGILLFLTVVGIPVALVLFESISTIFNPVRKKCVSRAMADAIEINKANKKLEEQKMK